MSRDERPAAPRARWPWAVGTAAFVALVGYSTLISVPARGPTGIEHNALDAAEACRRAVADDVTDARFPFPPNVAYQGEARYRASGTVEAPMEWEVVRRNYECVVTYTAAEGYRADSIRVWQSH